MGRNFTPREKLERREGERLFLKGERSASPKAAIVKRNYPPGMHGPKNRTRLSGYGTQLREKQKVKRIYRLMEKQFRQYYEKAAAAKGNTAQLLLQYLETRLDNTVYRLGFCASRDQARQSVKHGHIFVNGNAVSIPSYSVRANDVVSVKATSAPRGSFTDRIAKTETVTMPTWLTREPKELKGTVTHLPEDKELEFGLHPEFIVEFYSR